MTRGSPKWSLSSPLTQTRLALSVRRHISSTNYSALRLRHWIASTSRQPRVRFIIARIAYLVSQTLKTSKITRFTMEMISFLALFFTLFIFFVSAEGKDTVSWYSKDTVSLYSKDTVSWYSNLPKNCSGICGFYRLLYPEDTCQCDSACAAAGWFLIHRNRSYYSILLYSLC